MFCFWPLKEGLRYFFSCHSRKCVFVGPKQDSEYIKVYLAIHLFLFAFRGKKYWSKKVLLLVYVVSQTKALFAKHIKIIGP